MPRPAHPIAVPVAAALFAVALALVGCAEPLPSTGVGVDAGEPTQSAPATPSAKPSTPPTGTSGHYRVGCRASQLHAQVTRSVSVANQPLTVIALHNTGAGCFLDGYVTLRAVSGEVWGTTTSNPLPFSVTHSENHEVTDPGPSHVDVPPGRDASFAIGTTTALDNPLYWLTSLTISVPGDPAGITVATNTAAMARHGRPVPISETAIVAGQGGPPEQ